VNGLYYVVGMGTRKNKAEETKKRILEAAYKIVREEGIHALSSTKIVKTAGISQGGFFHHFPQIEDLYLYMLDQIIRQMDEELSPKKFKTFRTFMRSVTDYTLALLDQAPETITTLFYFLSQSHHKPDYRARLKALLDAAFSRWAEDTARYFDPPLSAAQKDRLIRILDMYFCGFSFHYLVLGDQKLYRKISDDFADMLIRSIEKENAL